MTTFPPTFVALIVEVFLPLMTTSQRKKGEKEKGKGRDKKKDKESKTKKKKGNGVVVGGRAYPLLAYFKLFFFFFYKLISLHTLGT